MHRHFEFPGSERDVLWMTLLFTLVMVLITFLTATPAR